MPKIQSFDDLLDRAKRAQQAMRELNLSLIEAHDRTELAKLDHAINALAQLNQDAEPELLPAVDAPPQATGNAPAIVAGNAPESTVIVARTGPAMPSELVAADLEMAATEPASTSARTVGEQLEARTAPATPSAPPRAATSPSDPGFVTAAKRPAGTVAPARTAQAPAGPATPRAPAPKPIVTPTTVASSFAEQISKGTYTRRLRRVFVTGAGQGMVPLLEMPHRNGLPSFDNCLSPDDSPVDGAFGIFVSHAAVFAAVLRRPFMDNAWQVIETIHCRQQRDIVDAVADLMRRPNFTIEDPL